MKKNDNDKIDLLTKIKRKKQMHYIMLYSVTLAFWLSLFWFSLNQEYFSGKEFCTIVLNNIIGIIPPILIFDFFNEKLSRDVSAMEMSNRITDTLMSSPETLELFTEKQKKNFIKSTIASIVKDDDATEMLNDSLSNYLFSSTNYRIKTGFDYDFELCELPSKIYDNILTNRSDYLYVQEKLYYKVKYLSIDANNTNSNFIKIGFVFNNKELDEDLREKTTNELFKNCIFREILDLNKCDIDNLRKNVLNKDVFQQLFKLDLKIDGFNGILEDVKINERGIVCKFSVGHDMYAIEHSVRIIFHMPKRWDSILKVALVDPVKSPRISLSYPEDKMDVEMFSFLSKSDESSLEVAHEYLNGVYDVVMGDEWVYPISGVVFSIKRKNA